MASTKEALISEIKRLVDKIELQLADIKILVNLLNQQK